MGQAITTIIARHVVQPQLFTILETCDDDSLVMKVSACIEKGVSVNAVNGHGSTPLHYGAQRGHLAVVKYLIENLANVNIVDSNMCSPLYLAAADSKIDEMQGHRLPIHVALSSNAEDTGIGASHEVIAPNRLDVVRYLVENGADINAPTKNGNTPLYIAAGSNHLDIVKYLASEGADVDARTRFHVTALYIATHKGLTEVVKYLIDQNAEVNPVDIFGTPPLYYAAEIGALDCVKCLVERGALVNLANRNKSTPLLAAAARGRLDVVKYLVDEQGADVNVVDVMGFTALNYASQFGRAEVKRYLESKGCREDL